MINKEDAIKYIGEVIIPPMTSNLPKDIAEHQKILDALRMAQQALQNEINFAKEIEKIKAEINEKDRYMLPKDYVFGVIDNHIKKLKGEI